jgi:hypothetical protein
MERLFGEPLFYIYLIYGVSFLLLAYLIGKGAAGSGSVPLIAAFNMLALFGLTHGITEITDWVRFVRKTLGAPEMIALTWLSQVCLVLSFVMLFQFALNLLAAQSTSALVPLVRLVPVASLTVFLVIVLTRGMSDILQIGLLGRYTFGFGSAALAAIALVSTANTLRALGDRGLVTGLLVAGAGFAFYAVVGGLIVVPILGAPVQLFRTACAVTIALSAFSLLRLSSTVAAGPRELSIRSA